MFTRASTPPNFVFMLLKTSAIFSADVKSTVKVVTLVENVAANFSRFAAFISSATTWNLSSTSRAVIAPPIPPPAPVTTAILLLIKLVFHKS